MIVEFVITKKMESFYDTIKVGRIERVYKMKRWCMVIDVEKCENCNNCFLSCKDEHHGNDWPGYTLSQPLHGHRWMNILQKEHGQFPAISVAYKPKPCFHCDNAPCIQNTVNDEIYKRDDGVVIIDPHKAKGKKELVKACPYGAIWWNEDNQTAQKCTLCAHLLDGGWQAPRCVQSCPTGALTFHSLNAEEFDAFAASNNLSNYHRDGEVVFDCVLYKNIDLYNKCFVAGSVATKKDSIEDCVKGAGVELYQENSLIAHAATDTFGDFKFHGLDENSGIYEVRVSYDNRPCTKIEVGLGASTFVGTIWI
jgi:Fe-S-cluster-containing dehydrogenase component